MSRQPYETTDFHDMRAVITDNYRGHIQARPWLAPFIKTISVMFLVSFVFGIVRPDPGLLVLFLINYPVMFLLFYLTSAPNGSLFSRLSPWAGVIINTLFGADLGFVPWGAVALPLAIMTVTCIKKGGN